MRFVLGYCQLIAKQTRAPSASNIAATTGLVAQWAELSAALDHTSAARKASRLRWLVSSIGVWRPCRMVLQRRTRWSAGIRGRLPRASSSCGRYNAWGSKRALLSFCAEAPALLFLSGCFISGQFRQVEQSRCALQATSKGHRQRLASS